MSALQRQLNVLEFTLNSLLRRRSKVILLLSVYSFVIFLIASVSFYTQALRREARSVLAKAPEIVVQRVIAGRQELVPLAEQQQLEKIRGVQSVKPRLWGYYYDPVTRANFTLIVSDELHEPGGVLLGAGAARLLAAQLNQPLEFNLPDGGFLDLTVRGTLSSDSELESSDLVLVHEEDFRRIFGYPDGVATDFALHVRNDRELATIAGKVLRAIPNSRAIQREEIIRTYESVFNWRSGLVMVLLAGAVLAFIILAWDKASGLSAEERREIGILKATGWETSDVLLLKFWEGTVVSLSAFLLGTLGAYAHVFFGSALFFEPALKGWSVLYPHFRLTPVFSPYELAIIFFLTVAPYTVATIVPCWRAATVDPDAVMRG